MRHAARRLGALALVVLGGACGEGSGTRGGVAPTAPRLVGATTHVTVSCPTQMEYGTTGTCVAYGYDATNTFTNSNATSWTSSNTSLATITSSGGVTAGSTGGSVTITAVIDGVSGSTAISIVPPLSVTISGPSSVKPNAYCEFTAHVSGGADPLTYSWSQDQGSGGANPPEIYYGHSTASYFLAVTVTDANGHTVTGSKWVTVSSGAPVCLY